MAILPEIPRGSWDDFAPIFTRPTLRRFLTLLGAAILTVGRRTIANLLRTAGSLAVGASSSYRSVVDAPITTEAYAHLGPGTIVQKSTPASTLSYVRRPDDAAARSQTATASGGSSTRLGGTPLQGQPDRAEAAPSELYSHDALGQLIGSKRGVLSDTNGDGSPDVVTAPSRQQAWTLDMVGDWGQVATNGTVALRRWRLRISSAISRKEPSPRATVARTRSRRSCRVGSHDAPHVYPPFYSGFPRDGIQP